MHDYEVLANIFGSRKRVLDPQGPFLQRWNVTIWVLCAVGLFLDPLFLYIPGIDNYKACLVLDKKLEATAIILRSLTDIFYIIHINFQFRTPFVVPSSRVVAGAGLLVDDSWQIARRYLLSYFVIDILAILPLPQVAVSSIIPKTGRSRILNTNNVLKFVFCLQFLPRYFRTYKMYKQIMRASYMPTKTARTKAAITFFLYIVSANVVGAFWYLFSLERKMVCWQKACGSQAGCKHSALYCDGTSGDHRFQKDYAFLYRSCLVDSQGSSPINFGIYIDAINSGVLESTHFAEKFLYCFWWALQNLSTLGQNLKPSAYVGEMCFAFSIFACGLVLFSFLIGIIQTTMLSSTIRLEEMKMKWQDVEHWMSNYSLPEDLRKRIMRHEQYKWQKTKGLDAENLLHNLPKNLRRDIKRHLCLDLLKRVPFFRALEEQILDEICDRLKPVFYTKKSYIMQEGDPVDELLLIMRGNLLSKTTNGGRTGFFNSVFLRAGDFCGERLLSWALDPKSHNLPISCRSVEALTEVEAFALMADDLKSIVASKMRLHGKQLQHVFRFWSVEWRIWAACFIQAAWRRYKKRKLERSCLQEEINSQNSLTNARGSALSLGVLIYTSRFAANAIRALRRTHTPKVRLSDRVLSKVPPKPAQPDFTYEEQ